MHKDAQRLAAFADARQHFANGVAVFSGDVMQQFASRDVLVAATRRIQRFNRSTVGFQDPQIGGRYDQDGLV